MRVGQLLCLQKIIRKGAGQREGEWNLLSVDEDDGAQPPAGTTAEHALLRFFDFFFVFVFFFKEGRLLLLLLWLFTSRGTEWPAPSTSPNKIIDAVYK